MPAALRFSTATSANTVVAAADRPHRRAALAHKYPGCCGSPIRKGAGARSEQGRTSGAAFALGLEAKELARMNRIQAAV